MTTELTNLAIEQLGIDVPVMRVEVRGNVLFLYLYGRSEPSEWQIPQYLRQEEKVFDQPDDLTQIKGIGRATGDKLQAFGIRTFRQLADADPEALTGFLGAGRRVVESWQNGAKHFLGE